ncbi:MAG: hypothetical protein II069_03840 [Oscillospiraceae bacterium]|nr:hypothetical protein [Oscillospiraceae bacterium]
MKSSPAFKILSVVMLAAVVLYFGVQIYRYLANPFATTLTYEADADDSISVTGWVVRSEETFHSDMTTITHPLDEGQRVGAGQAFAVAYNSSNALDTVGEIRDLELQLQQLEFALTSILDNDAAMKLDNSITGGILTLRQDLSGGDYSAVTDDVSSLKASVLKSSHSYSSVDEITANIDSVRGQIAQLRSSLDGAHVISAPRPGIFSAVCDGYESVLTPERLDELTPSALQRLSPVKTDGNVGKLIYGDTWYFVAPIDAGRAAELRPGQSMVLRMAKGMAQDVTVQVRSVGSQENGQAVVVLQCQTYLPQTTQLRHQAAELILRSYHGLRLPINSLRMDENGTTGVYCVVGVSAKFKPVQIIYRGDTYMLVRPAADAAGTTVLRSGDEIIITANHLENGLVVR